tara:strand:- start:2506 stop:4905 length:2400 start_codon:yes stop_codon:yes gene_type:complete
MADFSWAYINCDNIAVTSYTVPTGSLLFSYGHKAITGSQRFTIDTGSGDASTWEVRLTGNLDISGTIRSYKFETITYESTNYQGSTIFGNSSADTHQFTGSVSVRDNRLLLTDTDVAHGVTNVAATDVYGQFGPIHSTYGGLMINGLSDQENAGARSLALRGICNDTHTDTVSTVEIIGAKRSGVTVQALAAAETVLQVANHTTTLMTVRGNGFVGIGTTTPTHLLTVDGAISGSSTLDIVGATTLESTLDVTGAISTAAGVTASAGVSSSYAFVNNLGVNQGGTKSIQLGGDGTLVIAGGAADTTCLSASGDVNVVGKVYMENTLHVTGAISGAVGITGSSLKINDVGFWNANGNLSTAGACEASSFNTAADTIQLKTTGEVSGSGPLNIVGAATLENILNVTGVITTAAGVTASAGVSSSYVHVNSLGVNQGGTNQIQLLGTGEISGSGPLNIVGAATLESTLNITGAITTAAGVTASVGMSASYGFVNNLAVNDGGTKSIRLNGDGTLIIAGGAADTTCLSASGDVNIVGKTYMENLLSVSGGAYFANTGTEVITIAKADGDTREIVFENDGVDKVSMYMNSAEHFFIRQEDEDKDIMLRVGAANILQLDGDADKAIFAWPVFVTGEISGSGDLNIVGASTIEGVLNVTGAITTAAGVTASVGVSASYAFVNNLGVNDGGTKSIRLQADGTSLFGGKMTVSDEISGSGILNIVGIATFESAMNLSGNMITAGNIVPSADNSQDLGSGAKRWANLYTADLHLKNDRGDWTIIEEPNYLTVTNNSTGKKYKLLMEEID